MECSNLVLGALLWLPAAEPPIPASSLAGLWSPAPLLQTPLLQYLRAIFLLTAAAATREKLTWKWRLWRHLTANMLSFLTTDGIIHTGVVLWMWDNRMSQTWLMGLQ